MRNGKAARRVAETFIASFVGGKWADPTASLAELVERQLDILRAETQRMEWCHQLASQRNVILVSENVGCFNCLDVYLAGLVVQYVGDTAICRCGVDALIGDGSGYIITEDFLRQMRDYWFKDDGWSPVEIWR
jgi:hypothetical protein